MAHPLRSEALMLGGSKGRRPARRIYSFSKMGRLLPKLPGPQRIGLAILVLSAAPSCSSSSGDSYENGGTTEGLTIENDAGGPMPDGFAVGVPQILRVSGMQYVSSPCQGYEERNEFGCDEGRICQSPGTTATAAIAGSVTGASCGPGCDAKVNDDGTITLDGSIAGPTTLSITFRKEDGSGDLTSTTNITFDDRTVTLARFGSSLEGVADAILPGESIQWLASPSTASNEYAGVAVTVTRGDSVTATADYTGTITIIGVKAGVSTIHLATSGAVRDVSVRVVDPSEVAELELVIIDLAIELDDESAEDDVIAGFSALGASATLSTDQCDGLTVGARFRVADGTVGLAPADLITSNVPGVPAPDDVEGTITVAPGSANPIVIEATLGGAQTSTSLDVGSCP